MLIESYNGYGDAIIILPNDKIIDSV